MPGVYIDVFEQSILLRDRPSKSWSFLASFSVELFAVSLAILVPLATTNRLPDFHWKSVTVGAPAKRLAPEPIKRSSTDTHSGPVFLRRVFVPSARRTSLENRADSAGSFPVEPPEGFSVDEASRPEGIPIEKFVTMPAVARPPQLLQHTNAPTEPLRVSQGVQMAKLVKKVIPEYPPLAKTARVSGIVHLIGAIAKDGTVQNLQLISGHPVLARAAMEAVRQWIFQPTLLNGQPVEVIAPIDVNFTLGQ